MADSQLPTTAYQRIAAANQTFYASVANLYDRTESCLVSKEHQQRLEQSLDAIPPALGFQPQNMLALDACGGSGNVALKLLQRGMQVTVCDISREMLDLLSAKAAARNFNPPTVCCEVADFLSREDAAYHLITFSSALHHLQDIEFVLSLAFRRLVPGGGLFTIFDPTARAQHSALTKIALRAEYLGFKVFGQTSDLPSAIRRRLSRIVAGTQNRNKAELEINPTNSGLMAEYHVQTGIDDLALVKSAERIGYKVVWHKRRAECRFSITRRLVELSGDCTEFELLLVKPPNS